MSWQNDVYVTGANPFPGRTTVVDSGWGHSGSKNDAGVGINVYIAGGTGVSGAIPVVVQGGTVSGTGGGNATPASSGNSYVLPFSDASTQELLAPLATRVGFSIYNDSNQYYLVCLGPVASQDNFDFALPPQCFYESPYPGYSGIVTGIGRGLGSGSIRVKEMVP